VPAGAVAARSAAALGRHVDALGHHRQRQHVVHAADHGQEAVDHGQRQRQADLRRRAAAVGGWQRIWPRSASMLRLTTSMPTPRPDRSVTLSAVEKPGAKISCQTSASWARVGGDQAALDRPWPGCGRGAGRGRRR
jgi:hypothetical protein